MGKHAQDFELKIDFESALRNQTFRSKYAQFDAKYAQTHTLNIDNSNS